jgi:transposase
MKSLKYAVGIDVSKDDFKACISVIDESFHVKVKASTSFGNTLKGIKDFLVWARKHHKETDAPLHFLMEATGIYHENIAWYLHQQLQVVHIVLASKAKSYLRSLGHKGKNDKMDAQGLARMCAEKQFEPWVPVSGNIYLLRSLTRLHEDIQVERNGFRNRLEALEYSMHRDLLQGSIKTVEKLIAELDKQLLSIEKDIQEAIGQDAILSRKYACVASIKGVGIMAFAVVVAETDGFALIKNQRQLASYAGYDVVENQSGKKVGRTRISKKGNHHIRRVLHLPAFTVVKYEKTFRDLYERVYGRGGVKMKGYVAVQRKLLCMMYTLWKKEETFQPQSKQMELSEVDG